MLFLIFKAIIEISCYTNLIFIKEYDNFIKPFLNQIFICYRTPNGVEII